MKALKLADGGLRPRLLVVASMLLAFWGLEAVETWFLTGSLDAYGIRPRRADGLAGILWAPFLHGGFSHLAANTVPFLVLASLTALRRLSEFLEVTLTVIVLGGLGTWLFGPANSVHIGASGLIFGYFGFLVTRGFLEANFLALAIAVLVGFLYGGIVWGVLPAGPGISWQGHLFGLLGGVACAWLLAPRRGENPPPPPRNFG